MQTFIQIKNSAQLLKHILGKMVMYSEVCSSLK